MNIQQAKQQIERAMQAYFSKDEFGAYRLPAKRQRPVFPQHIRADRTGLIGP